MSRYLSLMASILTLSLLTYSNPHSLAQEARTQSSVLADIQQSVIRAVGAQKDTVEVAVAGNIVIVTRVNSNMNNSTHGGRDNEASAIADVVTKALVGKSEIQGIISIRVQYVAREPDQKNSSIIDTIEFREDPNGNFQFHKT